MIKKLIRKTLNNLGYDVIYRGLSHNANHQGKFNSIKKIVMDKTRGGKKLIVYGSTRLTEQFCSQLHLNIAYCIDDNADGICCGKPVRNVYELAYESPQSFFVFVIQPNYNASQIIRPLTAMNLLIGRDYHIIQNFRLAGELSDSPNELRDSYLGYSRLYNEYDNKYPGFKVFGNPEKGGFRIVTLGASTTDPSVNGIASWPEHLYYLLKKTGIEPVVFNGGMNGSTSSSELVKLIRDVLLLCPDIVISYGGTLDFVFETKDEFSGNYKRPFISSHQLNLYKWIAAQEGKNILHGMQTDKGSVEIWLENQIMMHSVAKEFGIRYIGILAANVYSEGIPSIFLDERAKYVYNFDGGREIYKNYLSLKYKYNEVEQRIAKITWLLNFRHIFDKIIDHKVYYDYAHVHECGNQIIAANVLEALQKREIIR
jgi:hypothetical protein